MSITGLDVNLGSNERLSCLEISVSSHNQRKAKNPRYDEIKQSIMQKGMQQSLHVVFHPSVNKWILSRGGQTRLNICQELYKSTQDEKFLYPEIIKTEFTSDMEICLSHLIENDLRGETNFIEKSFAVEYIEKLLSEQLGKAPTQEEVASAMTKGGMPIRRQSITAMKYAVNLSKQISNDKFNESVTRPLIDDIRSLRIDLKTKFNPDDFDAELVDFINRDVNKISIKAIKKHFSEKVSSATTDNINILQAISPYSNRTFASSLTESTGLDNTIGASDHFPGGYVVRLPSEISLTENQSKMLFLLGSMSGAFSHNNTKLVIEQMNIKSNSISPGQLIKDVQEQLGVTNLEVAGLAAEIICGVKDEEFKSLIRLFAGVRESSRQAKRGEE